MKNIKYFFIVFFAFSLFSMPSFAQNEQDVEKVKQQIEKSNSSFMEAFSKGDAKAMTKGYAMDAIVLPPNMPEIKGSDAIVKLWQGFIDMGKGVLKLNTVKINVFGNAATTYHTYNLEVNMKDGQVIKDNGRSVVVYEKQKNGDWLIIYDIWNSSVPIPENNDEK